jgi:hypothetical protein
MTLSLYGNSSVPSLHLEESSVSLAGTIQSSKLDKEPDIDYSVRGNRLHRRIDGSLEVIAKTPCEVIGERVIRPLLDTTYDLSIRSVKVLKRVFSSFDNVLSRTLNFLPGAEATSLSNQESPPTELEKCLAPVLQDVQPVVHAAVQQADSERIQAAEKVYGPSIQECILRNSYTTSYTAVKKVYKENQENHDKHAEKLTKALNACKAKHPSCTHTKIERLPEKFTIKDPADSNRREWVTTQGYLSWVVYVENSYWPDSFFDNGGYNYNDRTDHATPSDEQLNQGV